jgi:glycosyltransferase involved in cell wall biosynthesis
VPSPKLSVVIPVHNESANIAPLCERLLPVLERIDPAWEAIFVDDGSRDETWSLVKDLSRREPRIGAVSFSRNFGKEIAIAAGLDHARGDAVVIMDADLQHPPEMIEAFVERWKQGYDMVYGQRTDRSDETRTRRGFAHLFYRWFSQFGEVGLPEGAGDFRLIDRKGVEVLKTLGEKARFSKGLYAWIGFKGTGVPFVVEERRFGATKWSFRKLVRFAFDGIAAFSTVPLRIWTYLGFVISFLSIATAIFFFIRPCCSAPTCRAFPASSCRSCSSPASSSCPWASSASMWAASSRR